MGISTALLCAAIVTALVPAASLRFAAPRGVRDLAQASIVMIVTGYSTYRVVGRWYGLYLLEILHLGYLIVVVTLPLLFGIWFFAAIRQKRRSIPTALTGLVAAGLVLGGIWGTHIEPNRLHVERVALYGDVDEPFTIGVLADLQTPNVGQIEWSAVNALISEQPDVVLVPGDLFQGPSEVIDTHTADFVALLSALVAEIEVVAVVSGDVDTSGQLEPIVEAAGATYMNNRSTELVVRGQAVRLTGVAVHSTQDKRDTLATLGTPTNAFSILLSHRPGITYGLPPNSDVDLIVAGHTHGSQIKLPIISNYVWYSDVPPSISNGGLNYLNDFLLYVSTGVGMERHTSPQVRFGVPPSVGIIEVIPRP